MEGNTDRRQFPENSPPSQLQNSAFRLSAAAKPFAPAPLSKAHSFNIPSSCPESDTLSPGDYTAQAFHFQDYTPEGLEECLDLSKYGAIIHDGEFSGSNCSGNSAGSLYFGPSAGVGEKGRNTCASMADRSLEKEGGNDACKVSKSLDGTHSSFRKMSAGISARGTKAMSQPEMQIAVENLPVVNLSHRISGANIPRSPAVSSTSLIMSVPLNVKPKVPKGGGTVDVSFIRVDKNALNSKEPDEDSPCWRGSSNLPKSPFTTSRCANTKFPENAFEACRTLNPMAPQYIPQSAERRLNSSGSRSSDTDEIDEPGVLGSEAVPPFLGEENITSHRNIMTEMVLPVPRNDIEDVSVNEAPFRISEYLSTCPSLDAEQVVNTMHDLSEFLMKQCSENHFLSEPQCKKIPDIIENLSVCNGEFGPRRSCSLPNKSSADMLMFSKFGSHRSNGGKVVIAPPELGTHSTYVAGNSGSSLPTKKVWDSCTFIGNIGAEIAQADSNGSTVGLEMDQQMDPQTLLYKNLWLQATEELHSMKSRSLKNVKYGAEKFPGRVS